MKITKLKDFCIILSEEKKPPQYVRYDVYSGGFILPPKAYFQHHLIVALSSL